MADLDVKPKKRGAVWPWILLLILIAVAAYFFLTNKDDIGGAVNGINTTDSTTRADSPTLP